LAPTCSNCGASDFVWANELKTGNLSGGTLSLRSRGEIPLGTRICRTCGHADLFLRELSILQQPHLWRPGEFIPITPKPAAPKPAPTHPHAHPPAAPPPPPPPTPAPAPSVPNPLAAPPSAPLAAAPAVAGTMSSANDPAPDSPGSSSRPSPANSDLREEPIRSEPTPSLTPPLPEMENAPPSAEMTAEPETPAPKPKPARRKGGKAKSASGEP
jgi:hypothetical protein